MASKFRVDEVLKDHPGDREELENYARDPGRTIDEIHEWLTAPPRSYNVSRTAVFRWKREFEQQETLVRMQGGGQFARAVMDAAKASGGLAVHDAAILQVGQMIFDASATMAMGEMKPQDLSALALALQRLTLSKVHVEDVRAEMKQQQQQALAEADKAVAAGADGKSVVAKFRELLNLPPLKAGDGGAA